MEIFPQRNVENNPYQQIADHLGFSVEDIYAAYSGLHVPEWVSSEHLDDIKATTHTLNAASRHASNLLSCLRKLSPEQRELLVRKASPTEYQIELLIVTASEDAKNLGAYMGKHDRKGGSNPAAKVVAEGTRRLFRRARLEIKYGQHPEGGPSTKFGAAVEFSLGAFGIRSDWRRAAESAFIKQRRITERLQRIIRNWHERQPKPEIPDINGISIIPYFESDKPMLSISLDTLPSQSIQKSQDAFDSSKAIAEFAEEWARKLGWRPNNTK